MKRAKKALLLALCALLLVGASIMGTLAYLTSQATVTNTFTVGNVAITMDESPVDEYGNVVSGDRRTTNSYKLIPGHNYTKDPVVHVTQNSESCYVFVKITNNIASYIDVTKLEAELVANGWQKLNENGVWWKLSEKGDTDRELEVFQSFTVLSNADSKTGWDGLNATIDIVAYAIQKDTMGDAPDAWAKLTAQLNH